MAIEVTINSTRPFLSFFRAKEPNSCHAFKKKSKTPSAERKAENRLSVIAGFPTVLREKSLPSRLYKG